MNKENGFEKLCKILCTAYQYKTKFLCQFATGKDKRDRDKDRTGRTRLSRSVTNIFV